MSRSDPLETRFLTKVYKTWSCWFWIGAIDKATMRGRIRLGNRRLFATTIAYRLYRGAVPEGVGVLHKCDTPQCVNPDHLYLGTPKDNTRDAIERGSHLTCTRKGNPICPKGHSYTETAGYNKIGKRYCKQCSVDRHIRWRNQRRARGLSVS
jgi:hypothetical protein